MRNLKPIKQYSVFLIQALEDTIQELSHFYRVFLCLSLGLMSLVTFFYCCCCYYYYCQKRW